MGRVGDDFEITPLVAQDLCFGECLRLDFAECGLQLCFGFPFRAQELVTVGDGRLDENPSPLWDGDADRLHCLDRLGRVRQRNAVGLNAGKTVARDVKGDTGCRNAEPCICLFGCVRGLADPL